MRPWSYSEYHERHWWAILLGRLSRAWKISYRADC